MPYSRIDDLPTPLKRALPTHAQEIYKSAFNSAMKQGLGEDRARKIAWSVVKTKYHKGRSGKWEPKTKASLDADISAIIDNEIAKELLAIKIERILGS